MDELQIGVPEHAPTLETPPPDGRLKPAETIVVTAWLLVLTVTTDPATVPPLPPAKCRLPLLGICVVR